RRAGRLCARTGRRHHGFCRRPRGRTLPLARWRPFLLLLVLVPVLLVGLRLSEHACAAALDWLGVRKAAGAGRKGEDTKENCQCRALHRGSRNGLGGVALGRSPLVSPVWGTKEAASAKSPPPLLFLSNPSLGRRAAAVLSAGGPGASPPAPMGAHSDQA